MQIKSVMAIVAIILLVAIVTGLAYKDFGPSGPKPAVTTSSIWLEKLARESGGDFNKLSPKDQADLNQKTRGEGAKWLKLKYNSLSIW